jgi:hypothetical protein
MTTGQVPVDAACAGWPTVPACGRERDVYHRPRPPRRRDRRRLRRTRPGRQPDGHGRLWPVSHPTGDQVLRDAARQVSSASVTAEVALEVLGFAAFIVFLGHLADVLRRTAGGRRDGIAAGTGIVAGAVMVAVKLGSAAPIMALWVDHGDISPQLALVLNDLGSVAFVVSWLPAAIFVAAAAAALYRAGLVGRPTAYCGLVLGAAGWS